MKECKNLIKYRSDPASWTCGKDVTGSDGFCNCGTHPKTGEFMVYRTCSYYEPVEGRQQSIAEKIIKDAGFTVRSNEALKPLDHTKMPLDIINPYVTINMRKDSFQTINAHPTMIKKHMQDLTEEFKASLRQPIPHNDSMDLTDPNIFDSIQLFNIHIYGGPSSGKTTTARAIGEYIYDHYGDDITDCIESTYIPEAIAHMDPSKTVFVLSIDDPMREQDARKPNDPVVAEACQSFFEIRHILMHNKVKHQLKEYLGLSRLSKLDEHLIATRDWTELAAKYPLDRIKCSAIIFTIFGPQVPQLDQRLHVAKIWEIYKAYGSLDVRRRAVMEAELQDHYYIQHLKDNEKLWRIDKNMTYMSRSLVKDPFGEKRCGWLWIYPPKKMVFKPIERGEKRYQERLQGETEILDEWALYLYKERKSLHPPYIPHGMIHERRTAINNFIRDIQSTGIDPRMGTPLTSQDQTFFRKTKNLCTVLDDRISKIFAVQADEEKIKAMAEALIERAEVEEMTPWQKKAQALFRSLSHKIELRDDEFLRKKGIWTRIWDEILFMWVKKYGKDEGEEAPERTDGAARVPMLAEQMRSVTRLQTQERGDTAKFNIELQDAINLVLQERPDLQNGADIYCAMYGLCNKDHMTCKEMSLNSMDLYGQQLTEEQVRYRKEIFEGILNQKIGDMFEFWLEAILNEGYEIPGVLEDVERAERVSGIGKPDLLLTHTDGKQSVAAAKCYNMLKATPRSESFEKGEFNAESIYHSRLLRDKGKIFLIYRNLGMKDMLSVKVFDSAIDIPENVFFSPKDAGKFVFTKKECEGGEDNGAIS